jgi:transcriptional regulator with XRE-family HTH domain
MAQSPAPAVRAAFAERLRLLRITRGFKTARSLAQQLDIDENRYTRYERAEVEPDLTLFCRICGALGVTANDLLCFNEGPASGWAPAGNQESSVSVSGFHEPDVAATEVAPRRSGRLRQDSIAWRLAAAIAAVHQSTDDYNDGFALIQRTSAIFSRLQAAPFDVIASLTTDRQIASAPPDAKEALKSLIDQLIADIGAQVAEG